MTQEVSRQSDLEVEVQVDREADLDTMTATRETLEDYTLRFAPREGRACRTT